MRNKIMDIWGREFDLEVIFDCYSDEEILPIQEDALSKFCDAIEEIKNSETEVKRYCLEQNPEDISGGNIENIFRYVMPKYIFIVRDEKNRVASLMCDYKFDMEHGLAIVFQNEKLSQIGPEDIIL